MASVTRHVALLAVQVLLVATLFALLQILADRHNARFDLTPTQAFVLAPESRTIAETLTTPIELVVFYNSQEQGRRREMHDLLHQFADASPHIRVQLLDLDRSPALAKKYGVSTFNTGVLVADGTLSPLKAIDEQEITNAIVRLTHPQRRTLCFVTAHGEHSPRDASDRSGYSEVSKALEREGFGIETLRAIPTAGVPQACSVVVIGGPSQDLLPGETDRLTDYLAGGGRVLFLVDPSAPQSVVEFLAGYGIRAGNDVIVDDRNRFIGADSFMPRVPIFDEGTFRKNLNTAAVFSLARSIVPLPEPPARTRVLLLALTSDESWAHAGGIPSDRNVVFDRANDRPGPLPVGVMVIREPEGAEPASDTSATPPPHSGRMIVFGDSDFASNLYLNLLGNKDLFMSSIGVLTEDATFIAVRRKGLPRGSFSPISLTAHQSRLVFWATVVVVPAVATLAGIGVTWRRRRRAMV